MKNPIKSIKSGFEKLKNKKVKKQDSNSKEELIIPEEIKDDPEAKGFWLIEKILKVPKVKVDREKFLREALEDEVPNDVINKAVEIGTADAGIYLEIIKRCARKVINETKALSNTESAILGAPGGMLCIVGVIADLIQFYTNLIILVQKLCYLYGMKEFDSYGELRDDNKNVANIILIFLGEAMGIEGTSKVAGEVLKQMGKQYSKQASKKFLLFTKPLLYSTAKKVAKSIGLSISKKSFAKAASKAVPVIGSVISFGLNWVTFSPCANRLNDELQEHYKKALDSDKLITINEEDVQEND